MFLLYFLRRGDGFAVGVMLWWIAKNFWEISVYAGDAQTRVLPLVGGGLAPGCYAASAVAVNGDRNGGYAGASCLSPRQHISSLPLFPAPSEFDLISSAPDPSRTCRRLQPLRDWVKG
jgi:hypothetical protein